MKNIGTTVAVFSAAIAIGAAVAQPPQGGARQSPLGTSGAVYTEKCASCHGADLAGGRGPSLFADSLLSKTSDAALTQTILEGRAEGGMPSFKGQMSESDINQLISYLRIRSGQLKGRPSFLPDPDGQIVKSEKQTFKIEVVAAKLETPWGEAFLPDGRMLVTERTGRIRIIDHGKLVAEPVKGTPPAWVRQDGGYFDIAVHPDYKSNGWIYLSFSEVEAGSQPPVADDPNAPRPAGRAPSPPSMTRVIRGRINANNEWIDQQDIFHAPAEMYTPSVIHYGTRFLFDDKAHLFWAMGERGDKTHAQDLGSPLGKIHRVNDDGSVPADNPFVKTPGAVHTIWSYGHRNPEGLAFDPRTGLLWESEHGPTGGDEINIIEKGHNYGWGVISMGLEPGITLQHQAGMEDPIRYYTPTAGPSGISLYLGDRYPGWKNSLFVSALTGQKLIRFEIKDRQIAHEEVVFQGFGRVRQIITGPDGYLYVLIQNSQSLANSAGMVVRLMPVP